ncbi:MAG: hypothetical protein DPW16_10020 [Chloroflexi bacterium]|nr:hypothetical protein [Chloroflexota bacterium]
METKPMGDYLAQPYRVILQIEEDGWSASIPDLPGCIGAGDTITEALAMLEDAKSSWIEASLKKNLPIPEPH